VIGMRVFVAGMVAAFGVAGYAVAALLWDRRVMLRRWLARRQRAAEPGGPAGDAPAAPVYAAVLASFLIGTALMVGSCIGLVVF
jgi:hypothetical protein